MRKDRFHPPGASLGRGHERELNRYLVTVSDRSPRGSTCHAFRQNQKACPSTVGPIGKGTAISLCSCLTTSSSGAKSRTSCSRVRRFGPIGRQSSQCLLPKCPRT